VQVLAAHCVLSRVQTSWHRARTCPLNRQGTAAAAHSHACFSKGYSSTASRAPPQRLWGIKAQTYRLARTYAHTRTHRHTYTHAHTYKRPNTRTHTHMHMHAHLARVMGFVNFLASLVTLPHLSLIFVGGGCPFFKIYLFQGGVEVR
jgi:hypothetical protein